MVDLAVTMPGFLGIETARKSDGVGITVSYSTASNRSATGASKPNIASPSGPVRSG